MSTRATREQQRPTLLQFASRILGPVEFVADHSWDYAEAHVVEVSDSAGGRWIAKHCFRTKVFDREVSALEKLAPAVGRAPTLRAKDREEKIFIMPRLPGRAGTASTSEQFRQAGELTRRLHDATPATPLPDLAERLTEHMESWLCRFPDSVDRADVAYARGRVKELAGLPATQAVCCHGDNQPRNWLVDDNDVVWMIDFGRAGARDVWLRDIERMYFAEWYENPELQDAFLDGYGRVLTDDDVERLRAIGAAGSIGGRLWAREHHAPEFEKHLIRILDRIRSGKR